MWEPKPIDRREFMNRVKKKSTNDRLRERLMQFIRDSERPLAGISDDIGITRATLMVFLEGKKKTTWVKTVFKIENWLDRMDGK